MPTKTFFGLRSSLPLASFPQAGGFRIRHLRERLDVLQQRAQRLSKWLMASAEPKKDK